MYSIWSKILSGILIVIWIALIVNPLVTVLAEPTNPMNPAGVVHVHTDACYRGHNHTANYCYQLPHVHNQVQCPYTTQQVMCNLPTQAGYAYERDWGSGYVWCGSPICQRYAQNNNGLKIRAIDIPYTCTTCKVTQTFRYTACVFKNGTVVSHDDSRSNYTTCKQARNVIRYQCPIAEGTMVWNCGHSEEDNVPCCQEVVTAIIPAVRNQAMVQMGTDVSELSKARVQFLDGGSREEVVNVSGYVSDRPGEQELTLSYGNFCDNAKHPGAKSVSLFVRVVKQVKGIQAEFIGNPKIEGQAVSRGELRVSAVFTDDSREEITEYAWTEAALVLGENVIRITWNGQETTLLIEALPKSMIGIEARYLGGSRELGVALEEQDTAVMVQYNNGTEEAVRGFSYHPPQVQQVGDNEVTVEYNGFQSKIMVPGYCNWDREGYERTIQDLNQDVSEMTQLLQQIRTLLEGQEPIDGIQQLIRKIQELELGWQQDRALLTAKTLQNEQLQIQYEEVIAANKELQNKNQENQSLLQSYKNQIDQLRAELQHLQDALGNNPVKAVEDMKKELLNLEDKRKDLEADLSYANNQYDKLAKENSKLQEENNRFKEENTQLEEENRRLKEELAASNKTGNAASSAGGGYFDLAVAGDAKLANILNLTIQTDESGNKTYYTNGKVKDGWGISEIRYPKNYETDLKKLPISSKNARFYAKHKEGSITYLCQMEQMVLSRELPKIRVLDEDIGQTSVEAVTHYRFKSGKIVIPLETTSTQPHKMKLEYQIVKSGYDFDPDGSWKTVRNHCIVIQKPMMARVYIKATDIYGNQRMIKTKGFVVG